MKPILILVKLLSLSNHWESFIALFGCQKAYQKIFGEYFIFYLPKIWSNESGLRNTSMYWSFWSLFWKLKICWSHGLLTCCNFSIVIISSHTTLNWLIKIKVFAMDHNIIILYISTVERYFVCTVLLFSFSNNETKSLFTPWKLGSIRKSKYCYFLAGEPFWLIFISINCSFKTWS